MILSWISASFIQVFLLFLFKAESHRDRLQPAVVTVGFSAAAVENWAIMCWHMPENHCAINACSVCIWQVCCWVCPPVVRLGFYILHPHIISLQVPALYGMAAALRRVIGYWADCFACGLFFRPFVVSFFFSEPPTPHSQLLFACTWMHSAHAGSTLALLCIGLFQADFFFFFS